MNDTSIHGITPFIVMDVLERAIRLEDEGRSIIHLEIGEPDFATPRRIVESAVSALRRGETHYTDSRGTRELRSAVASHYNGRYGTDISEERVLITMGTSPALLLALSVLLEQPGGEIILGDPCYPCYPNFIRYTGGAPRFVETLEGDGFQPKPEAVGSLINGATRAIILNSPANPTGTLIPEDDLRALCRLGVPVISDEIYHGLVYGETEHSVLEFTDEAFVLNGFSKLYAMTGWRLGYIIAPERYVRKLHILQQNFFISPNAFVQQAGVTALTERHEEIDDMRARYDARRRYLLAELPGIGLGPAVEPKGAFYFFVDASRIDTDSYGLAFDMLDKAGVAVAPGVDFGSRGEGHLRISYANSLENIAEGIRRIGAYIAGRGSGPSVRPGDVG
ncbi:MAG TPA: pyridoxal phosphate-dependent aminotransferase, partial [Candidatus Eisenbacteria bacterium]|nr:pyridoxal phosphate-dependent aminotransferase [Candidatus Eisenbacteria bacterium]